MEQVISRDNYSKTTLLKDGGVVQRFSSGHTSFKDDDGNFQAIDQTLAYDDVAEGWGFVKHSFKPFLPRMASGTFFFTDKFKDKNQTLSYRWETALDVEGRLVEDFGNFPAVIYDDAFGKGTDLIATFSRHTLKLLARVREGYYGKDSEVTFPILIGKPQGRVYRKDDSDPSKDYELLMVGSKELDSEKSTVFGGDTPEEQTTIFALKAYDSAKPIAKSIGLKSDFEAIDADTMRLTKRLGSDFFSIAEGDVFIDPTTAYNVFAGTGAPGAQTASWALTRAAVLGTGVEQPYLFLGTYSTSWTNYRGCIPIDLTGLSGTVTGAVLNVRSDNNSNWDPTDLTATKDKHALVLTTQASTSTVALGDYDNITLDTPAEGATRFQLSDGTDTPSTKNITLNATGLAWITGASVLFGLRTAYFDVDNNAPTGGGGSDGGGYLQLNGSDGANPPTLDVTTVSAGPAASRRLVNAG